MSVCNTSCYNSLRNKEFVAIRPRKFEILTGKTTGRFPAMYLFKLDIDHITPL